MRAIDPERIVVYGAGEVYSRAYRNALPAGHRIIDPRLNLTGSPEGASHVLVLTPLAARGTIWSAIPRDAAVYVEKPVLWEGECLPPLRCFPAHTYLFDPRWQWLIKQRERILRLDISLPLTRWCYQTEWRSPEREWTWVAAEEGWHYVYLVLAIWPDAHIRIEVSTPILLVATVVLGAREVGSIHLGAPYPSTIAALLDDGSSSPHRIWFCRAGILDDRSCGPCVPQVMYCTDPFEEGVRGAVTAFLQNDPGPTIQDAVRVAVALDGRG